MKLFLFNIEKSTKIRLISIVTVISITILPLYAHIKVKKNLFYNYHIASVQMHKKGWELSYPIITRGSGESLIFSFDDLSGVQHNFYYKVILCNADWTPSNLFYGDYIKGFEENPFTNVLPSFNTKQQYWHYSVELPNADMSFTLPGNYKVLVFDYNNPDSILVETKFFAVSDRVNINGRIKDTRIDKIPTHRLNFKVIPTAQDITRRGQLFVDAYQNLREDKKLTHIESVDYEQNAWVFDDYAKIDFPAGREFFQFEMKDFKFKSFEISDIEFRDTIHYVDLKPILPYSAYSYYEDINGKYYVKYDKARDKNIDSDYCYVTFNIKIDYNFPDYQLYIVGAFNNWTPNNNAQLNYNPIAKQYEKNILLKQGLYNYDVLVESNHNDNAYIFEQSVESEQDYLIFVYYRDFYDDYDRLVGFVMFNSLHKRVIGEF